MPESQDTSGLITLISYDESGAETYFDADFNNLFGKIHEDKINWINIDSTQNDDQIISIASAFSIHPLILEDIRNTEHLPKIEDYDKHLYMTLKMLRVKPDVKDSNLKSGTASLTPFFEVEHLSIILGENYVITIQEGIKGDVFDGVRSRLMTGKSRALKNRADYLFYLLFDTIVDNYFIVMEKLHNKIDRLDEQIIESKARNPMQKVIALRRQLSTLRRLIYPLSDELDTLLKDDSPFISEPTLKYLRDVSDHLSHINSTFETFREMIAGMLELYMTNLSLSMNSIMKIFTIITTIFIPLTFIAGIYGMNFEYMPELEWRWGYFAVLGLMLVIAIAMFLYIKLKKWM